MKKALFVWGGWDGHQPEPCSKVMAAELEKEGFSVELTEDKARFADAEALKQLNLIVPMITMSEISKEQTSGLLAAVKGGVGMAGWHGGMGDAFRSNTEYHFVTGGQFICHPGGIIDYTVEITKPDDPIVKGISGFKMTSEQYYMHVDPSNEVLATTTFHGKERGFDWIEGTVMPVAWKRRYGAGRVFYSSLGHVAEEFTKFPQIREIMKRGMLWAAK